MSDTAKDKQQENENCVGWLVTQETFASLELEIGKGFGLPLKAQTKHSICADCKRYNMPGTLLQDDGNSQAFLKLAMAI